MYKEEKVDFVYFQKEQKKEKQKEKIRLNDGLMGWWADGLMD